MNRFPRGKAVSAAGVSIRRRGFAIGDDEVCDCAARHHDLAGNRVGNVDVYTRPCDPPQSALGDYHSTGNRNLVRRFDHDDGLRWMIG